MMLDKKSTEAKIERLQKFDVDSDLHRLKSKLQKEGGDLRDAYPQTLGRTQVYFEEALQLALDLLEENRRLHKLMLENEKPIY